MLNRREFLSRSLVATVGAAASSTAGSDYQVWIFIGQRQSGGNVLLDEPESRSRLGNVSGSISDGENDTFVVTHDGKSAAGDAIMGARDDEFVT